jgi:hypothetical protein
MDKLASLRYLYLHVIGRDIPVEKIGESLSYLEGIGAYNVNYTKDVSLSVCRNIFWVDGSLWPHAWDDRIRKLGFSCEFVLDMRFVKAPIMWLDSERSRLFIESGYMSVKIAKTVSRMMGGVCDYSEDLKRLLADDFTIGARKVISVSGFFGFMLLPTELVLENCGLFSGSWGFLG